MAEEFNKCYLYWISSNLDTLTNANELIRTVIIIKELH